MESYQTPAVFVHDFSKFDFIRNQGTCGPDLLGNARLHLQSNTNPNAPTSCGNGFGITVNDVAICLTEAIDPNRLNGLIVETADGQSLLTSNCVEDTFNTACDNVGYICIVNGTYGSTPCLLSLSCSDGTLVDACPSQTPCDFGG